MMVQHSVDGITWVAAGGFGEFWQWQRVVTDYEVSPIKSNYNLYDCSPELKYKTIRKGTKITTYEYTETPTATYT